MTFESKVYGDYYKNNMPFGRKDPATMAAYRKREHEIEDEFKKDLFAELGIESHPKREKLWEKAWERGHSAGFYEVYHAALDLVDLIRD